MMALEQLKIQTYVVSSNNLNQRPLSSKGNMCNIFQTKLLEHINSAHLTYATTLRKQYVPNGFGKQSYKAMKHTTQPAGYPNHYSYKEPKLRR